MIVDLLTADLRRIGWRPMTRALEVCAGLTIVVTGVVAFAYTGRAHPFDRLTGVRTGLQVATVPLVLAGYALGASILGADYASRSLTTLLTWEPRRHRVLATRAVACAAATACAALAASALLGVALLPAAIAHGTGPSPTGGWYVSLAALATRVALLTAATAVVGVSCAALTGSTVGAMVSLVAYWLVVQQAATAFWPKAARWLLLGDADSWIAATPGASVGSTDTPGATHSMAAGGVLFLTATVAVYALATWRLIRRDIT